MWQEILAGASLVQHQALEWLESAAMIVELPSTRITAANSAAVALLGVPAERICGHFRHQVIRAVDDAAVERTLRALSTGSVDAVRARRRLIMPDGTVREHDTWLRVVDLDGQRSAIMFLTPSMDTQRRSAFVWIEPLVVGTTDAQWRIVSVSIEMPDVLGGVQQDYIGRTLLAAAHPDDVGELLRITAAAAVGETICRNVRLRHQDGSWVSLHFGLVPLTAEKPPPLGFVILPHQPEFALPDAGRLSELEQSLRHIVAELRGAGLIDGIELLPSAKDHPELSRLTSRQWEILIRLMRGDRVATIAADLFLTPGTVRNQLAAMYTIFDVHSQAELLALLRPR